MEICEIENKKKIAYKLQWETAVLFYRKINKTDKHQFEQSETQKEKTGSIQIINMKSKENTL